MAVGARGGRGRRGLAALAAVLVADLLAAAPAAAASATARAATSAVGRAQIECVSPGSSTTTSDEVCDSTSDLNACASVSIGGNVL